MTVENTQTTEKKSFWQLLTAPHPSIEDFAERRFASVLATLMLAFLPLYFLPEGIRAIVEKHTWADIAYFGVGSFVLGLAYIFSRGPRPRWGAALTLLYFLILPFAALVTQADRYTGDKAKEALIWSVPIMLMALILLRPKDVKWVVFLQLALYLIIPAVWDGLTYAQVFSTFWLVIAVGGLMMFSAFVQSRYLHRAVYEAERTKKSQRHYRALFYDSPVPLWEFDFSSVREALEIAGFSGGSQESDAYIDLLLEAVSKVPLMNINKASLKSLGLRDIEELRRNWISVLEVDNTARKIAKQLLAMWDGVEHPPIEVSLKKLDGKIMRSFLQVSIAGDAKNDWSKVVFASVDITERKEAERRFRDLFLSSPVTLLEADFSAIKTRLDGFAKEHGEDLKSYILEHPESMLGAGRSVRLLDANLQAQKLYEAEDLQTLLDNWLITVDEQGMLALRDGVIALWEGRANEPIETIHQTLTKKEKNVVVQFSVRAGYEDNWKYINISVDDVTDRRAAEASVRQLASAVEASGSGIVITDKDSIIEFANPAAAQITGYTLDELHGSTPNILKSGLHEDVFYESLWETIGQGDTWRGELINKRKDGSLYWESQVISPIKNSKGKVTHYVAVKEDITQKKEFAEQLRYLSNATEQTASGIVITNVDGIIEYINPAFTVITGFEIEDLYGKTLDVQRSGEHLNSFYEELDETMQRGEIWKGEIINRRKDGSDYWEAMTVSPIKNEDGAITQRVFVKEDISFRKELETALALAHEEALVASDMKTQLLANVSHDMRTPLGGILGYTEMLQSGVFEPLNEGQDNAMRAISSSAQRLLDFVNNLLSQAQIDTGKIVLNKTFFKPEKLITAMGGELSFARSKGLAVETDISAELPARIEGDTYWLGQILHNLVSNAIKFTPENGTISIELCPHGNEHWSFSVTDTGKGIAADAQGYIFEPFRQVDGSIQRETHTGSGLGLSIVRHLVRLMDGDIQLESEVGKGSTFTVILPLIESKEN